nr:MAG TPA: minor capsid protein [Caudoviricetes sp.]
MELELVKSLRRNLKRHQKEEEEEGFRWEMWQKAKLRNLRKYRKENKEIIDKISPEVEKIVEEALQSSYRTGQNIFNKIIQRIKTLFFKKKRVDFPKDISHHKLSTPPPQEDNFFGINKKKLQVLQEEAEKVLPESKKDSPKAEQAKPKEETKAGEPETEKDQPEPPKEAEAQEAEPFRPEGKAQPPTTGGNDIKLDNTKEKIAHDLKKVQAAVWRRMDDVYRQTVYRAEMNLAAGAKTLEQAIDMATKEFLQKGIDCIEYKDGKRVNIASYAEMALRTAAHRAKLLGEGKKRDEWGIHTVFVSGHANTCPLCAPWQGKILIDDVFSSGTKEEAEILGYPLLSTAIKAGLLHPNCRHNIATYFPGITQLPKVPDTKKAVETYKAEQEQRELERQIKKWKRSAEGSQDPVSAKYAKEKVKEYQNKMREHLEKHPELRRSYRREKIY